MFTIDFSDHTGLVKDAWYKQIEDLLEFAKKEEHIEDDAELSVTFVDKQEIQEINRTYRDKDKVTDVISFALEEDEPEIDFSGLDIPRVLGDIIICTDVAQEQANNYGHSFERELGFLALHGFWHLLGYDHIKRIWINTRLIMKRFKYALDGLKILIQKDYKFLLHVFAMIVAIVFGLVLNINRIEWIFILIAIALVLTVEALNTAIEYVVDLVTVEYHDLAKYAKDIAAFSVLIVSILAFIIGLIVFLPHFIALF